MRNPGNRDIITGYKAVCLLLERSRDVKTADKTSSQVICTFI